MDMATASPTEIQMQTDCGHCIDDNVLFPSCMTWLCANGQFFAPLADGFQLSPGSEPVEVPVQTFLLGLTPAPDYPPPKQTPLYA